MMDFGCWILDVGLPYKRSLHSNAAPNERPRPAIRAIQPHTRDPRPEHGFVLVCVLWVLALLTVITVGFQRRALMDARAARFTLDHTKAMYMARGAVERGIVEIRNKGVIDVLYKQAGRTSVDQRWAHTMDMLQENAYFQQGQAGAGQENSDLEGEICRYWIRDEEGLVNINTASEDFLRNVEGLSPAALRKIMRRRTMDSETQEPPQPFQTLEEVRELEGIKGRDEIWFGTEKQAGLRNLLTTCWGNGQINVNTASAEVLRCIPDLRDNVIDAITSYRAGPDGELGTDDDIGFANLDEIAQNAGISGESLMPLRQYCKVDSEFFTITGVATLRQGKVMATCSAMVQLDQSGNVFVQRWREEFVES